MKERTRQNAKRALGIAVLLALGLSCFFYPPLTGFDAVNHKASSVAKEALAKNAVAFGTVSVIKAALAVVEGSTAGGSAEGSAIVAGVEGRVELELGDVVQPVYDVVDFVWKVLLYGLAILSLYEIILEFSLLRVGLVLMGAGFIAWAAGVAASGIPAERGWATNAATFARRYVRPAATYLIFVGALVAYLVPATILGTDLLKTYTISPLKKQSLKEIRQMDRKIELLKDDFISIRDVLSAKHPMASIENARYRIAAITKRARDIQRDHLLISLNLAVLVIIEVLVFPILTAFLLYIFSKKIFDRLLAAEARPVPSQ